MERNNPTGAGYRRMVSVRLRPDVVQAAKARAAQENRSLANLLEWLLLRYLGEIEPDASKARRDGLRRDRAGRRPGRGSAGREGPS